MRDFEMYLNLRKIRKVLLQLQLSPHPLGPWTCNQIWQASQACTSPYSLSRVQTLLQYQILILNTDQEQQSKTLLK